MDIKAILNHIAEDLAKDLDERNREAHSVRKDIGEVSEDLLTAFEDLEERKKQLEDQIEINIRKMERLLHREVGEMQREVKLTNNQLWQQVYKELKIKDHDKKYSLNRKTGTVSEEIKVPSCFKGDLKDLF